LGKEKSLNRKAAKQQRIEEVKKQGPQPKARKERKEILFLISLRVFAF